jgi:hypothetical protein
MKLAHYHRARGDEVRFSKHIERQRGEQIYDRVYGSAIFSFSADRVAQFRQHFLDAIVGGTYDVSDNHTVSSCSASINTSITTLRSSGRASQPRLDSPSVAAGSNARFACAE